MKNTAKKNTKILSTGPSLRSLCLLYNALSLRSLLLSYSFMTITWIYIIEFFIENVARRALSIFMVPIVQSL